MLQGDRVKDRMQNSQFSPLAVLLPVSIGTGLSLVGDSSLYAVLPTHVEDAGITLASVGIMLSANRFVRLLLNGPAGLAYDRCRRRPLFVGALLLGALSTALYALGGGFWPLFAGRLLWGLSWSGIWVGGNAMIADICDRYTRGRMVGLYQTSFFLGTSSGSILGGLLTDWLGYSTAMGIGASLTLAGALTAFFFLPETFRPGEDCTVQEEEDRPPVEASGHANGARMASAIALLGVHRLTIPGMLSPTFGLLLLETFGGSITMAGMSFGVATLTGVGLGVSYIVSMVSAPVMGRLSDRASDRWRVAAGGLVPGMAGFVLLALGSPFLILLGLPLAAFAGGSNQGLSAAIVGDLSREGQRGRKMGILFTVGDLTSAIGPLLAYALIPVVGLKVIYVLSGAVLAAMMLVAVGWAVHSSGRRAM
ncbi:MAG: MFS transporter [Thermodesulfobacteriota bacterium]